MMMLMPKGETLNYIMGTIQIQHFSCAMTLISSRIYGILTIMIHRYAHLILSILGVHAPETINAKVDVAPIVKIYVII